MNQTLSYSKCEYCDDDCAYQFASTEQQPCWGKVIIAEDFGSDGYMHCCEGHFDYFSTGEYSEERRWTYGNTQA